MSSLRYAVRVEAPERHTAEVELRFSPDADHVDIMMPAWTPGSYLIRDYARLASRDVPSARETVAEVEANDLPALTRRANAIYDRMHRGTLIDLEVAREMMALDVPIQAAAIEVGESEKG